MLHILQSAKSVNAVAELVNFFLGGGGQKPKNKNSNEIMTMG
jgi:hypothetical protein